MFHSQMNQKIDAGDDLPKFPMYDPYTAQTSYFTYFYKSQGRADVVQVRERKRVTCSTTLR